MAKRKSAARPRKPASGRVAATGKNVFIGWSGESSRQVAQALYEWLPALNQDIKPWMSENDIDKGVRWANEISNRLGALEVGIFCLTPTNLDSRWILFEAGALSSKLHHSRVCPFLFHLKKADIKEPLAQFHLTLDTKEETRKMLLSIDRALESRRDEKTADRTFEAIWPKLERALEAIPEDATPRGPERDSNEILEEILNGIRDLRRTLVGGLETGGFLDSLPAPDLFRFRPFNVLIDALRDYREAMNLASKVTASRGLRRKAEKKK
jgi:hypothetical protein